MKKFIKLALVGMVGLVAGSARADSIWIDDANGQLGKVDVTTGAVTLVGGPGVVLTDIAFDPSGNLYGINFTDLYSINKTTGAETLIGGNFADASNALTFATSGTLLAASNSGNLYTINTSTGAQSTVGAIGFTSGGDLAFNGGNLYLSSGSDQLIKVDPTTGAGTLIGSGLGAASFFGLANDGATLYGVAGTELYTVNTTTGVATAVLNYAGHGLDTANGAAFLAEAVPTPLPPTAYAGMALLGLMGAASLRKRYRLA